MAITAYSKVAPEWYTPECEYDIEHDEEGNEIERKKKDDATRFKIRPLTPAEKESVSEFAGGGVLVIPPRNFGHVLRMGVTDWENFADERGKPVKYSPNNVDQIPGDVRMELAGQILERTVVTKDEEKN